MNKLLDARADEEAAAYLRNTDAIWMRIVGSREAAANVTVNDMRTLELRYPKFCHADAAAIAEAFDQGTVFSSFGEGDRDAIRREIFSIETIFPSLHTFSQDIYVLEVCAASMRHIVTPRRGLSIRQTLLNCFGISSDEIPIVEKEHLSSESSSGAAAVQELWAFMLANFPDITRPTARSDTKVLAGPHIQAGKQETILRAANLAHQLGFRTPEIQRLVCPSSGEQDGSHEAEASKAHNTCLSGSGSVSDALYLVVGGQPYGRLHRRCGRPRKKNYQLDQTLLTRPNLRANSAALDIRGPELTSFFVLRCQYMSFFRSVTSSNPSAPLESGEKVPPEGPADAAIPAPHSLEQSVRDLRRYSDSSEYTSVTVVESIDDEARPSCPAEPNASVEKAEEQSRPTCPQILFKEYSGDGFHDVERVDADRPETVASVAKELKRIGKTLLSVEFDFIQPHECFKAAQISGANAIIVLPHDNVKMSEHLKWAVRQLPRGEAVL